ncbi:hexokinase type 2-like [Musca domestica]|uniref:Phosphotransferase n=1 Tax=Musca domestica TaxID=7370 RepID=A0A9J7DE63_MUSDO|nr:hexokinase type 2-like [Musca domestica]
MEENGHFQRIQEICAPFEVNIEQLFQIKNQILDEIASNLETKSEYQKPTNLKCFNTFLQDFPQGCEHGRSIVVNVEEENFRIHLYQMRGQREPLVQSEFYEINSKLLENDENELFVHIANTLQMFLKKLQLEREPLAVVFVFQFPLNNQNSERVNFTEYTKRFDFKNQNKDDIDVRKLLESIIMTKCPRTQVVAVISQATAVFCAATWKYPNCAIGVYLGSEDTSMAYKEKTGNFPSPNNPCPTKPFVAVHLDWGAFGDNGCLDHIRHELDIKVDKLSPFPRKRIYEKMICGQYVGELARQIFLICTQQGFLFNGEIGKQLITPFSFNTRHICEVLAESPGNFDNTRLMFDRLGVMKPTDSECSKVHFILECLAKRSAALLAAGCACLVDKISEPDILIAIEGSFYGNCLIYQKFVSEYLRQLTGEGTRFQLKNVEDSVGLGAAVVAAITEQQKFLYQAEKENESDALGTETTETTGNEL